MADSSLLAFFNRTHYQEISVIVDQTFFRLMEPTTAIDNYFPITNYLSRKLLLMQFKANKPVIASIIAEEQEIPRMRSRAEITEQLMTNLKLGKQYVFKDKDYELMKEMELYMAARGPLASQLVDKMKEALFGTIADLTPSIVERMMQMVFQVATTGACQFTDPLTGARVDLSYPTSPTLMLPALTGAARWSQPTTADPLRNLEDHAEAYYQLFGMFPEALILRRNTLRQVANANATKIAMLRRMGADSTTPDVTGVYLGDPQTIDLIIERTKVTEVVIFDSQYSEEAADGSVTDKYFLPDDTYTFAARNNIEGAMVPTVEKDFAPGLYVAGRQINDAPRIERVAAVGNGLPFVRDSRKLAARKVA